MVSFFGITLAAVEQIFAVPLLKLYTSTPEAIEVGFLRMEIVVTLYFVAGMMEICNHSLRGIGYSLTPMIIALIGTCALRLLWIFALLPVWESVLAAVIGITEYTVTHQLWCIFTSWPATWVVTCIVAAIFLVVCFKKQAKKYAK
jgi:Na+-driven multidrug efflux pump